MALHGSTVANGYNTSPTVNVPTVSAGDIVNLFINASNNHTISVPSGFTQYANLTNTGGVISAFWKVAGGSEPSTYSTTISGLDIWDIACTTHSGRNSSQSMSPQTTTGSGNPSVTLTIPAITAAANDDLIAVYAASQVNITPGTLSSTPSGFTLQQTAGGNYNALTVCTKDGVSAGSTGTTAGTISSTAGAIYGYALAVNLAAASGGGNAPPQLIIPPSGLSFLGRR